MGPLEEILAYRDFMGWTAPWYSTARSGPSLKTRDGGDLRVYLHDGEQVYLTYENKWRGIEPMLPFGHGGSYGPDPFYTLRLYQSASQAIPGGHQVNFSLWKNDSYDAIVDDTYRTSPTETDKMVDFWTRAMEIWLPQLPDIMIEQGYHRLPTNETYWTGWPNADNPYVNSAFFHLTPGLIVHNLQPTGA